MMATIPADDIKKCYIGKMGERLGNVHHTLIQEVSLLHRQWDTFDELYGKSSSE